MKSVYVAVDAALHEATKARGRVQRLKVSRVRGVDHIASLKATAQTWFHKHKPIVEVTAPYLDLTEIDACYQKVLEATTKSASKKTYLDSLDQAKKSLVAVRNKALSVPVESTSASVADLPPDFSPLAGNREMQDILIRRWNECAKCVAADAHLAAIVMMGGLLEALFVSRAIKMPDKSPLLLSTNAPKDKNTGKVINYQEWMLDSYIKVGTELGWITSSAKNVADTLKEYRNFVHPAKELRYGIKLSLNDSSIFWQVTKALTRQLLLSS